jgi:hypothetical protein
MAMTIMKAKFSYIKPSSYLTGDTYVSTTEPSLLMLCKSCGFHGGDYEGCRLLGVTRRNIPEDGILQHHRYVGSLQRNYQDNITVIAQVSELN